MRSFRQLIPSADRVALLCGILAAGLVVVGMPLAAFAHDLSYGEAGTLAILTPFAAVGFVLTRRVPGNPIGWVILLPAVMALLSTDAGFYAVRAVRLGDHGLPLARVAVFLAAGWLWLILFLPLPIALFPDGRLPRRWRWTLPAYLTLTTVFVAGLAWQDITGIFARHIEVDSSGELAVFSKSLHGWTAYTVEIFVPTYLCFSAAWVIRLVKGYRRATGALREQLKWLFAGGAICISTLAVGLVLGDGAAGSIAWTGITALPLSIGVGVLKYRLYEIDKLISRALSYLIITGVLAGIFAAIVLLTTRVLPFASPVAVAASTLVAAALFNPLRLRVQRLVDRRYNRAHYDAAATMTAFTERLRGAVHLEEIEAGLVHAVNQAIAPVHASVWIRPQPRASTDPEIRDHN